MRKNGTVEWAQENNQYGEQIPDLQIGDVCAPGDVWDGETFERVAFEASEKLGVEI